MSFLLACLGGIVDPYGRILSRLELRTQTYLTRDIRPLNKLSFYARCVDALPVVSLTLAGIFFILALAKKADERKKANRLRHVT